MSKPLGIAAQVIGVMALMAIVYFAFLDPSDPGELSSIDADGGINVQAPPRSAKPQHREERTGRQRRPDLVRAAGIVLPVPLELGSQPPAADTPAGSQYGESVAKILARVAQGE